MKTFYSEKHKLRDAKTELYGGQLVQPFERPSRAEYIHDRVAEVGLGPIVTPDDFGMGPILKVHDADFVQFLQEAWALWEKEGFKGEALPTCWPSRRMSNKKPAFIEGQLGFYALASETSYTDGTWEAAYASAQVALSATQEVLSGEHAFALCRPPGHHAAYDMYGGYCFLNNAAVSAQYMRDNGKKRVAIVDVDFHHGNGTQEIFYDRDDVMYVSLHGDPARAYPYTIGYADEVGAGKGRGSNINIPFAARTGDDVYVNALADVLNKIHAFGAEMIVVSLGLDTFITDPICDLSVTTDGFRRCGELVKQLGLPAVVLQEGGYDVDKLGINVQSWLVGLGA